MAEKSYAQKAKELFESGCNCSQSVITAFADVLNLDEQSAKKLSIGLGGGVGRMREVCGAVSGAAVILGYIYGGENADNKENAYSAVREFADEFKAFSGSVICRELLGLEENQKESAKPQERTQQYYQTRPCSQLVFQAARIIEEKMLPQSVDKTF